eukprot:15198045-Alexandrium_andersonii.AAC.1
MVRCTVVLCATLLGNTAHRLMVIPAPLCALEQGLITGATGKSREDGLVHEWPSPGRAPTACLLYTSPSPRD